MALKHRPEGLEIVLTQVLVAVLTLATIVPLFAFLDFSNQTNELACGLIVFAAWFLTISMLVPVFQRRGPRNDPERAP